MKKKVKNVIGQIRLIRPIGLIRLIRKSRFSRFSKKNRIFLFGFSILLLLNLSFLLTFRLLSTKNKALAAPWATSMGSWTKRKQITLVNNSGATLHSTTTYKITIDTKALYDAGSILSSCDDLRVIYQPDDTTAKELKRNLEFASGTTCSTSTATQVVFPLEADLANSASSSYYYLYFSNSSASSYSSADALAAYNVGTKEATFVAPFNGTTTALAAGSGTPTTETGAIRYSGSKSAMSFDGLNDKVTVSGADVSGGNDFTVEFWQYNRKEYTEDSYSYYRNFFTTNSNRIIIQTKIWSLNNRILSLWINDTAVINSQSLGTNLPMYQWSHVALTFDATNGVYTVYIDGVNRAQSSAGQSAPNSISSWYLGSTTTQFYSGDLDEFRVSNILRYSSNFTPPTSPFIRDEYTKLLLHFDENGDDPRNTGKAIDDSGNGNHGTITGAKYVGGLVGVDGSSNSTNLSNLSNQSYAAHSGIFVEEGTTNKVTNPSFEHTTYSTNWSAGGNITLSANTTAPYFKFGAKSAKLIASADDTFVTSINAGNTNTHTLSAYVYDGTSGNVGGTVSSSVATLVFNGVAVAASYSDQGGGWWRLSYSGAGIASAQNFGVQVKSGKTIYLDGVQLEQKAYPTSYTDGTLGTGYAWSGTANESTSTRTDNLYTYTDAANDNDTSGTVSFWVKPNWSGDLAPAARNQTAGWIKFGNGGWGWGNGFIVGSFISSSGTTSNIRVAHFGTGSTSPSVTTTITKDKWYHVVYTWNGASSKLYVNYSSTATGTCNTHTDTGNIYLGSTAYLGNLNSGISGLKIFSDPLTDDDVADLYYSGLGSHTEQTIATEKFTDGEPPVLVWHLDEGYGATAHDSTTYQNNGVISGSNWSNLTNLSNSSNFSQSFDGVNDYLYKTYSSDTELNPGTDPFSVSAWFKAPATAPASQMTLLSRYSGAGYKVYMNTSGYLCFGVDDDSTWNPDDVACTATSFADSQWHHVEAIKGNTTIALYIDGNQKASTAFTVSTSLSGSNPTFYTGIDSDGSSNPWNGFIDEVRVYNSARSADQVKQEVADKGSGSIKGVSARMGGEGAAENLTDGLVGYWKMDEASWNGTAGEVVDASGNANHGVRAGDATTASGKYGNGGTFDGTGDYLSAGSASVVNDLPLNNMTVSGWLKRQTGNDNYQKLVGKGWYVRLAGGTDPSLVDCIIPHSGGQARTYSTVTTADTWTHWTVVWDATSKGCDVFINGSLANQSKSYGSGSYTTDVSTDLTMGDSGGMSYYKGSLDDLRIYNRALTPSEIRALYEWAPGPLAYWKLDENTGTTAYDYSGNGFNGTLTNSPTWGLGNFGSGVVNDGTQKYISVSTNSQLNLSNDFTIEGWIKSNGSNSDKLLNNYNTPLLQKNDTVDGYEIGLSSSLNPYLSLTNITKNWIRWDDLGSAACSQTEADDNGCLLNIGASGSWDQTHIMRPSVIKDGTTYKMWYNGYSGSNYRIGYATSTDGTNWTKYDNLSSADCGQTEANDNGCVFNLATGTDWDSSRVYNPSVIKDGSTYKMWYGGQVDSTARIGYATSTDGISWTRYAGNNCSGTTGNGCIFDKGITGSWDATWADYPSVIKDGSTYKMWYTGSNGTNYRIGYATSTDGINWTKYDNLSSADCGQTEANDNGCVFDKGGAGTWDYHFVQHPSVFKDANLYHMVYGGTESGVAAQIGYATSADGISWTRFDNTNSAVCGKSEAYDDGCILGVPGGTMWDRSNISYAAAFKEGETIKIYYGGHNGTNYRIGYTYFNPGISDSTAISADTFHHLSAVKSGTTLRLYVDGVLKTTGSTSVTTLANANNLLMGNLLNGAIDDVRIYNYARTPEQIVEDMNAGQPTVGSPIGNSQLYWKFDEGYGTTVNDSSGHNMTGTLGQLNSGSMPQWKNDGKHGKALYLNTALDTNTFSCTSNGNVVNLPSTAGSKITVSGWIRPDATQPWRNGYIVRNGNAMDENYSFYLSATPSNNLYKVGFQGYDGSFRDIVTSGYYVPAEEWSYITLIFSQDEWLKVYVNGVFKEQVTWTYNPTVQATTVFCAGGNNGSYNQWLKGYIDELKIFNYELSTDEIMMEYNHGAAIVLGSLSDTSQITGTPIPQNSAAAAYCVPGSSGACSAPVAEWKLDENTGVTAYDTSSNGNHGTLTSAMTESDWVPGKIGSALEFDNILGSVQVGDPASGLLDFGTGDFSLATWIKYKGGPLPSDKYAIITKGGDGSVGYGLSLFGTTLCSSSKPAVSALIQAAGGSNQFVCSAATELDPDTWYYVEAVFDRDSNVTIYINGKQAISTSISGNTGSVDSSTQLYIGSVADVLWHFNGLIDHTQIFNYARTPAQIAWDYNRGAPVVHYKMDECSGSTLHSSNESYTSSLDATIYPVSNGNTSAGTCGSGTATEMWNDGTTGKFNGSLGFDGTDDYVSIPSSSAFNITGDITLAIWFKRTGEFDYSHALVAKTNGSTYDYELFFEADSGTPYLYAGSPSRWAAAQTPILDSNWHHLVVVRNGSTASFYLDGKFDVSRTFSGSLASNSIPLYIGTDLGSSSYFMGSIDDVRIYNYALTGTQIKDIYNGSAVRL